MIRRRSPLCEMLRDFATACLIILAFAAVLSLVYVVGARAHEAAEIVEIDAGGGVFVQFEIGGCDERGLSVGDRVTLAPIGNAGGCLRKPTPRKDLEWSDVPLPILGVVSRVCSGKCPTRFD